MAETLTYDPGTDTVTQGDDLTQTEQEALAVGEALEAQQESLLAGKYQNAQELEKAYIELQKKLGEDGKEEVTTEEPEAKETVEETPTQENFYKEDGSVNYETVSSDYGEKLSQIFQDSNVDPYAISKHFDENQGQITDDMYNSLLDAGLSKSSVDSYLAGRAAESGYTSSASDPDDISDSAVAEVKQSVGGEETYQQIVDWASNNLDAKEIQAFDTLVNTGSVPAIKLAVSGLKAQYQNAVGYEGTMLSGKAPASPTKDVYRSQAELVSAMSDKRYDNDPAYRQDVIAKLERSDNLIF